MLHLPLSWLTRVGPPITRTPCRFFTGSPCKRKIPGVSAVLGWSCKTEEQDPTCSPSLSFNLNLRWYCWKKFCFDLVVSLHVLSIWVFALLIFHAVRLPLLSQHRAISKSWQLESSVLRFLGVTVISAASSCAKAKGNIQVNGDSPCACSPSQLKSLPGLLHRFLFSRGSL